MPAVRLNKVLRELNISIDRAVDFLESKGHEIEKRPTSKISEEIYGLLCDEFQTDADRKEASQKIAEAQQEAIDKILSVTVDFVAEVITCIRDKENNVISGDPEKIKKIYDTWVFSKDVRNNNPNWQLVDTLT